MSEQAVLPNFTSFDLRTVRYEEIHSIGKPDFQYMVTATQVRAGDRIMDCGCGYGAVTRELLEHTTPDTIARLTVDLVDESAVQLERAREELASWIHRADCPRLKFIRASFPWSFGSQHRYDVVLAKMVLHEVPHRQQLDFIDGIYHHLVDEGRLLLWDVCLSPKTADFYRTVIREKDKLAGFETMVNRRHFLTLPDIHTLFSRSGFGSIELIRPMVYRFRSLHRLGPELRGDECALKKLNEATRNAFGRLDRKTQHQLEFQDDGRDVSFQVNKGIFLATR